ncbi:hypothetical protein HYH03_003412 [Edaphochlamys debaryana]|uniref:Uncharacterized protein n=1 Tax=Edaphochlamys debaryana TaxID=47281 RepID=A0A835YBU4_9CHLO|nr:hypothetical protein HYH03_003412 [Edaphochlamys debaryana]|eukprot:KAG2498667.1 hypothetical protein HYH03_003412 [Edaphochlamys debaryana]
MNACSGRADSGVEEFAPAAAFEDGHAPRDSCPLTLKTPAHDFFDTFERKYDHASNSSPLSTLPESLRDMTKSGFRGASMPSAHAKPAPISAASCALSSSSASSPFYPPAYHVDNDHDLGSGSDGEIGDASTDAGHCGSRWLNGRTGTGTVGSNGNMSSLGPSTVASGRGSTDGPQPPRASRTAPAAKLSPIAASADGIESASATVADAPAAATAGAAAAAKAAAEAAEAEALFITDMDFVRERFPVPHGAANARAIDTVQLLTVTNGAGGGAPGFGDAAAGACRSNTTNGHAGAMWAAILDSSSFTNLMALNSASAGRAVGLLTEDDLAGPPLAPAAAAAAYGRPPMLPPMPRRGGSSRSFAAEAFYRAAAVPAAAVRAARATASAVPTAPPGPSAAASAVNSAGEFRSSAAAALAPHFNAGPLPAPTPADRERHRRRRCCEMGYDAQTQAAAGLFAAAAASCGGAAPPPGFGHDWLTAWAAAVALGQQASSHHARASLRPTEPPSALSTRADLFGLPEGLSYNRLSWLATDTKLAVPPAAETVTQTDDVAVEVVEVVGPLAAPSSQAGPEAAAQVAKAAEAETDTVGARKEHKRGRLLARLFGCFSG